MLWMLKGQYIRPPKFYQVINADVGSSVVRPDGFIRTAYTMGRQSQFKLRGVIDHTPNVNGLKVSPPG